MEAPASFTTTHRQILSLTPPEDMDELRQRMKRAASLGRAYAETNSHTDSINHIATVMRNGALLQGLSDDPATAACERAAMLFELSTWIARQCPDCTDAASAYGAALQHELTQLALCEDATWRAFQDGAWYALGGPPNESHVRGAVRAARTASSLIYQHAEVYLPTIQEDVCDSIDLFATLEVEGALRGWTIQVMGGKEETILHLSRAPKQDHGELHRLWHGSIRAEQRYGVPWIPTMVKVAA